MPRTGQRTCYDQKGNIIEHTGTGQDGDLQCGAVWPEPRFTENGDGTVSDHLTGLMWLQNGNCLGTLSWQAAVNAVAALNDSLESSKCDQLRAKYDDWFLPDILQLEALFNSEQPYAHDWLNQWGFIDVYPGAYWSATTSPNPYTGWLLHFDTGEVINAGKVEKAYVLLARREQVGEGTPLPETELGKMEAGERFVDNGDGTITDTITQLMWLKDGGCTGTADWQSALDTVHSLNAGTGAFQCQGLQVSYDDWALPNRHQLRSLMSPERDLPALVDDHPFVDVQPFYWSSTTGAAHPQKAYELFVGSGELHLTGKIRELSIWPVRPSSGRRPEREREVDRTQEPVYEKNHYLLRPKGDRIIVSWPPKRFSDLENGTLLDNVTGLMWLKDTLCLGQQRWGRSFDMVKRLNEYPWRMRCEEYKETYDDWQLPDLGTFARLVESAADEPAVWLTQHGALGLKSRDYWSVTENPINLYYAWALNLRQGTPRNYSKAFQLYVWPVRRPTWTGPVSAEPLITANDIAETIELQQGEKLLLSVAVASVSQPVEADLKIWYMDPEETVWWLAKNGEWGLEESVLYHGNLFELESYPVFYGSTIGMAVGNYSLHFDIETQPNAEGTLPQVFSSTLAMELLYTDFEEKYLADMRKKYLSAQVIKDKDQD